MYFLFILDQDRKAEDIDAELEALERAVKARQDLDNEIDEEERDLDLSHLSEEEILTLIQQGLIDLDDLDDDEALK